MRSKTSQIICAFTLFLSTACGARAFGLLPPVSGDSNPTVYISGDPTPGDVQITNDTNTDNQVPVSGTQLILRVKGFAIGNATGNPLRPNRISYLSIYSKKGDPNHPPVRPGTWDPAGRGDSTFTPNGIYEEWTRKSEYYPPPDASGNVPTYATYSDSFRFYAPGYFWFVGMAHDNWDDTPTGGYCFWSDILGVYHSTSFTF